MYTKIQYLKELNHQNLMKCYFPSNIKDDFPKAILDRVSSALAMPKSEWLQEVSNLVNSSNKQLHACLLRTLLEGEPTQEICSVVGWLALHDQIPLPVFMLEFGGIYWKIFLIIFICSKIITFKF